MDGYTKCKSTLVLRNVLVTKWMGTRTVVVVFRGSDTRIRRVYYLDSISGKSYLRLMRVLDNMEHEIEIDADRLAVRYFPNKGD